MRFYAPGTRIAGRYEVASRPMMGGMGIVYVCHDREEDRPVALKTFKPEYLPDRATRDRFLREGTAWVDLGRHPHVVRCYQVVRIGDGREVYLALELVAKEQGREDASLRAWLEPGRPLDLETGLLFGLQIARGMAHAAEVMPGFVHRDLKPENVLVGADRLAGASVNRLRVTDFGLASVLGVSGAELSVAGDEDSIDSGSLGRTQLTRGIVGTPLYMAPEQWRGEVAGMATDVYALGCILYEMLAGQRTVAGRSLADLERAHCGGDRRPLPESLPGAAGEVVERCLALEPGRRYGDWGQVEAALAGAYQAASGREAPERAAAAELSREERVAAGWSYSNMGASYLDLGKAEVARGYFERAAEAGRAEGEKRLEGAGLTHLGLAYAALGEARRAIGYYEQALAIDREICAASRSEAERTAARRGEGADLGNLGLAYADLGDARRAIGYYEQQLVITREIGDRRGEGNALGNLGLAYAALGEARRAIGYYEQRLEIAREIGDRRGEGNALGNLGSAYLQLGDARRAIGYYEQALAIDREIGDRRGEGADLGNLGIAYKNLGDARRAIGYYEQCLNIHREIGDRRGEGLGLMNMGSVSAQLGNAQQATNYWQQATAIFEEIGDVMNAVSVGFNLAVLLAQQGRAAEALPYAERAAEVFAQIGHAQYAQRAQGLVAQLQGGGAPSTGGDPAQQAFEAFQRAGSPQGMRQAVGQFPFMTDAGFIQAVEQVIAQQVPPQHRAAFEQRLDWLRQIAAE